MTSGASQFVVKDLYVDNFQDMYFFISKAMEGRKEINCLELQLLGLRLLQVKQTKITYDQGGELRQQLKVTSIAIDTLSSWV